MSIKNIVFDFGGVLVDWNPRYMYKSVFNDDALMERFLADVCTDEWNVQQDKGRSLVEGTRLLQERFPEHHDMIQLFYDKWDVMLHSDIKENVDVLYELKGKYKLLGLTNWSAETFPIALARYSFFGEFDGIVVSGEEKLIKPDRAIFDVLLERYKISAAESVFIDDNIANIRTANALGFNTIHVNDGMNLHDELVAFGVL